MLSKQVGKAGQQVCSVGGRPRVGRFRCRVPMGWLGALPDVGQEGQMWGSLLFSCALYFMFKMFDLLY